MRKDVLDDLVAGNAAGKRQVVHVPIEFEGLEQVRLTLGRAQLEQRVLQQAQLFANNKASLSSAMNDARKIMADVAPNSPLIAGRPVASKDRMEALQAQLASTTLERDALKREVVAQRTPTVVEAQPAAIAPAPAVRPNAAAAAVTATAVRKFQKAGPS